MTEKVRFSVSRVCVAASFVMAFTSGMILCACPGWPAIGVGLAIAALWLRKGREPLGSMLALFASLVMTGMHTWEEFSLPGSRSARSRAARAEHARQRNATNLTARATNASSPGPTTMTNQNR